MCISVQGRGDYIVVDNLIIAAKTFKKVDSGRKLGGYYQLCEYQFDNDGWAIPDNREQEVDFIVNDTAGNIIHLSSFVNLGFHVKPPIFWTWHSPDETRITAFVCFYTDNIQLVGIDAMVVNTFKIVSVELLKDVDFSNLYASKDDAIEQQGRVLEIVSKKED